MTTKKQAEAMTSHSAFTDSDGLHKRTANPKDTAKTIESMARMMVEGFIMAIEYFKVKGGKVSMMEGALIAWHLKLRVQVCNLNPRRNVGLRFANPNYA